MDYTPFIITKTLPSNSPDGTLSCVTVSVIDDSEMETTEYFSVHINNQSPDVVNVLEGEDILIIHILDDDCKFGYIIE